MSYVMLLFAQNLGLGKFRTPWLRMHFEYANARAHFPPDEADDEAGAASIISTRTP